MRKIPPVVLTLLIINFVVFLFQSYMPNSELITANFALFYWGSPYFHAYQFLTYMFLHGGWGHIFFNMFALWMFGSQIEYDLGSKRFLLYYLICGVGAGLLQILTMAIQIAATGDASFINVPMLGASGAVFGILLAFGLMHPNVRIMIIFFPVPIKAKYVVFGYGIIELLLGIFGMEAGVAHFAHVGGLLWGWLLLWWWRKQGKVEWSLKSDEAR